MATPIAPVRRRSTAQGRAVQYDKFGRPFRSEITQGPGFDLSPPAAAPTAPFIPTVENPATPDQVARAFYGPSMPGAPPPEMTQAQYQARKAGRMTQGGGIGMVADSLQPESNPQTVLDIMRERAGLPPATLGGSVPMSAETMAGVQAVVGASPARQERLAMAAGAPATVFIDGQGYMPNGTPGYGDANRYQGRISDEVVGRAKQTSGIGTSGGMGSGLLRGRLPASMENPKIAARTPMAGGGGLIGSPGGAPSRVSEEAFQDAWNRTYRPWKVDQQTADAGMGYSPVAASAGMIPSMAVGAGPKISAGSLADEALGAGVRYADSAGAVRNPSTPVSRVPVQQPVISPTITPQGGSWFPGQQAPVQVGAVVQPTGAAAAPAQQAAAAAAAGTPAAPVAPAGMSTRAKVGTAAGVGLVGAGVYSMANGQPVAPLPPAPEGTQNQYYSRMYSGVNGGLTTDPRVAANRAAFEAGMANRKNRAAGRGIAKGEARDLRMGQASPEVVARMQLANDPRAAAAMYAAQQNVVGQNAEPMLMAQAARYNTDMAAAQAELAAATTPEAQAAAMQRMQAIQQQQFSVPQVPTPDQFRQSMFGNEFSGTVSGQPMVVNTPIAPVRPSGSNTTASSGREFSAGAPSVPEEIAPGGDPEAYVKRQKEIADAIAARESFERRKGQAKKGLIPWGSGDMAIVSSMDTDAAAKWFADKYGVSYEDAYQQVLDKQRQGSGLTMPSGY